MRNPVVWGMIYFAVGCIFTYLAASSPGNDVVILLHPADGVRRLQHQHFF